MDNIQNYFCAHYLNTTKSSNKIVVTCSHDGGLSLDESLQRERDIYKSKGCKGFSLKNDRHTRKLTESIIKKYNSDRVTGPEPTADCSSDDMNQSYVIANVKRRFIDFNRREICAFNDNNELKEVYRNFHREIDSFRSKVSNSVLLDIHGFHKGGNKSRDELGDICIGTKFYTTCSRDIVEFSVDFFQSDLVKYENLSNISVVDLENRRLNGGYIVQKYGNPNANYHAMQFELSEAIRFDSQMRECFKDVFCNFIVALGDYMRTRNIDI